MQSLTLPDTAKLIKSELERRFPGCQFSVRSQRHTDSVIIRWIDGPIQFAVENAVRNYTRPNLIGNALAGAGSIVCTRLYSPATVAAQVDQRARYYNSRKPVVVALMTAGITYADLAPFDAAGQPIAPEDLRPWRYALETHNAYTPPAMPVQESGPTPAGRLAAVAKFYVPSETAGGIVSCEVRPAPEGGFWLKFTGVPSKDVRLAMSGALNARWDHFRKVWTTHASLDRITAALPAA